MKPTPLRAFYDTLRPIVCASGQTRVLAVVVVVVGRPGVVGGDPGEDSHRDVEPVVSDLVYHRGPIAAVRVDHSAERESELGNVPPVGSLSSILFAVFMSFLIGPIASFLAAPGVGASVWR